MNKAIRRFFAAALALTMSLGIAGTALAAPYDPGTGTDGDFSAPEPSRPSSSSSSSSDRDKITFVAGVGYILEAQKGTRTKSDGSVVVTLRSTRIPEDDIPGVEPADAYYEVYGWAILNKDDELEEIDLEEYRFTRDTDVYALYEDLWPVYEDMRQDRSDWYYQYVRDLSINGVVNGYPGYVFEPRGNVTWGEALKAILLAVGYSEQAPTGEHWASGYLAAAQADGLVDADLVIELNDPITRQEYASVAARGLGLEDSDIRSPFIDTEDPEILALYEAGIVEGSINEDDEREFLPDDYITRAEISAVLWRIARYEG